MSGLLNLAGTPRSSMLLDLDEALHRLAATDPRKVELIEMRYFGGMTAEESAATIGITDHMARCDLRLAHAWLHRELGPGGWRGGGHKEWPARPVRAGPGLSSGPTLRWWSSPDAP